MLLLGLGFRFGVRVVVWVGIRVRILFRVEV